MLSLLIVVIKYNQNQLGESLFEKQLETAVLAIDLERRKYCIFLF